MHWRLMNNIVMILIILYTSAKFQKMFHFEGQRKGFTWIYAQAFDEQYRDDTHYTLFDF